MHPIEKFKADVRLRAALLALGSLLLLILADNHLDGSDKKLVETIGTALLVAAAIDLLLEGRVRSDLTAGFLAAARTESEKILREVGVSGRLKAGRIRDISRRPPDWDALVRGAEHVVLVPHRILELDHEWAAILSSAARRGVRIQIHLPSETTPHLAELAERVGADPQILPQRLARLAADVQTQWQTAAPRAPGSLQVMTYKRVPGFGILRADDALVIIIPTLAGPQAAERFLTLVFDASGDDDLERWMAAQLNSIQTGEENLLTA